MRLGAGSSVEKRRGITQGGSRGDVTEAMVNAKGSS